MRYRFQQKQGFSLMELLIVIAIISTLAGIVLIAFPSSQDKARIAKTKGELKQIVDVIKIIEVETGCWPKSPIEANCKTPYVIEIGGANNEIWDLSDTRCGIMGDDDNAFPGWGGPYMQKIFKDPWGNDYFFDSDYDLDPDPIGQQWAVVVGSFGPNRVGPNVYDDDDVVYVLVSE